jgi:hypothetical protein
MQQAGDQRFMCNQMLLPAADLERWTKPLRGRFNSQN